MKTIYKYPFTMNDRFDLELPKSAQILTVQMQYGNPVIWALVDTEADKEKRSFEFYGTGHMMSNAVRKYIGTVQLLNGDLVFHLFELF